MIYLPITYDIYTSCDDMLWNYWYGYSTDRNGRPKNHQVRSIYDMENDETAFLQWDADGQLQDMMRPCSGDLRHHWWNEAGQLVASIDNASCGYYGYDGNGNRAYKLIGQSVQDQHNAGEWQYHVNFNDAVLYVNPYFVVTPKGYTKHYYNGSQRIAARLGGSWTKDSTMAYIPFLRNVAASLWSKTVNTNNLDEQEMPNDDVYIRTDGGILPACQYSPNITQLSGYFSTGLLSSVFSGRASERALTDTIGIYFYYPDHLGSASWITNSQGQAVQYIHYMPFGELWLNQQTSRYDERFKFTGKERDNEKGGIK